MKSNRSWEKDAEFGSDILGTGTVQGDLTGKVKTKQIGFVRQEFSRSLPNPKRKSSPKAGNKITNIRKK